MIRGILSPFEWLVGLVSRSWWSPGSESKPVFLKTCRHLHQMSLSRSLWICALNTLCLANQAPRSTFPCTEMTSIQLEWATLRPYLFAARLHSRAPLPFKTRVYHFAANNSATASQDCVTDVNFLPGGRFVITGSVEGWFSLWDLGHQNPEHLESTPTLLASKHLPGSVTQIYFGSIQHNSTYRFLVFYESDNMERYLRPLYAAQNSDITIQVDTFAHISPHVWPISVVYHSKAVIIVSSLYRGGGNLSSSLRMPTN